MFSLCLERYSWREKLFIRKMCTCAQSCPTLWNPMNCSPLGSSIHGFSRLEYWSRLPFPPLGDLPNPGIEPVSPELQGSSLPLSHLGNSRLWI